MENKVYIGNLPFSTQEETLNQLFSEAGNVESVKIITDPHSGRSKGFGFVEMDSEESAAKAVELLNGKELDGRQVKVDIARAREDKPRRSFGGGGGGGGGRGDKRW